MRRYDFIFDGAVMDIDGQLAARAISNTMLLNGENYLRATLTYFGLKYSRFKSTAALMCCPTSGCSRIECHSKRLPSAWSVQEACSSLRNTSSSTQADQPALMIRSKDAGELYDAWRHAFAFLVPGASHAVARPRDPRLAVWLPSSSGRCLWRAWQSMGKETEPLLKTMTCASALGGCMVD